MPRLRLTRVAVTRAAVLLVVALLSGVLAPQAARGAVDSDVVGAGFDVSQEGLLAHAPYVDFTVVNATAGKALVSLTHRYDQRRVGGEELYDGTYLGAGQFTEYASTWSDVPGSSVSYTWGIQGTPYQVQMTSYRTTPASGQAREVVSCTFFQDKRYDRPVRAPYKCGYDFRGPSNSKYDHQTVFLTVLDRTPQDLGGQDRAQLLATMAALCQGSDGGRNYAASCRYDVDQSSTPVSSFSDPVLVLADNNCSSQAVSPTRTNTRTESSTVGWSETSTVAVKVGVEINKVFSVEVSVSQAFTYAQSWTSTRSDSTAYPVPAGPGTRGELTLRYPTKTVRGDITGSAGGIPIELRDTDITLFTNDAPVATNDEIHLTRSDCPNLPLDQFKFPGDA